MANQKSQSSFNIQVTTDQEVQQAFSQQVSPKFTGLNKFK